MKKIILILFLFPIVVHAGNEPALPFTMTKEVAQACFTPGEDCTSLIVKKIDGASLYVLVQAYSFTSDQIAEALCAAEKRGVKVQAILDRSDLKGKGSDLDKLVACGIPTYIDSKHAIAHNKVMIIDGYQLITGSFNFTKAAQFKNAENVLILNAPQIAGEYTKNWNVHFGHSVKK